MSTFTRFPLPSVVLCSIVAAITAPQAFAQGPSTARPSAPDTIAAPRRGAADSTAQRPLGPTFDAMRRDRVEGRTPAALLMPAPAAAPITPPAPATPAPALAPPALAFAASAATAFRLGAPMAVDGRRGVHALDPSAFSGGPQSGPWVLRAVPRTSTAEYRFADFLGRTNRAPGDFSVRETVSSTQASARRALVNALADTPLGRRLGRVFDIHRDAPGETTAGPAQVWSRAFPLLSPKVNARARTVGVSLVWRF